MKIAYNQGVLPLESVLYDTVRSQGVNPVLNIKLASRRFALRGHNASMIADKDEAAKPGASTSATANISSAASVDGVVVSAVNSGVAFESAQGMDDQRSMAGTEQADADNRATSRAISDEDLMLDYARGNANAFTHLYTKYRPSLFRFLVAALGDESLATELYQETWTKVIGARRSYQPKAKFSTWLFTIARNNLRDYYRKFQPHLVEFDTVAEMSATDETYAIDGSVVVEMQPDEIAALAQQSRTLQLALDRLPLQQKEVMLLRYFAGMSIAEIAASVEDKPETIKSRLRYATVKLKQDLKNSLSAQQQVN